MTIAHDAYTAFLAELTNKRTEKEIWWVDNMGCVVTVELLNADDETYIVRRYYKSGQLTYEHSYIKDQKHGPWKQYYENGQVSLDYNYFKGKLHGPWKCYWRNGKLDYRLDYKNGIKQ